MDAYEATRVVFSRIQALDPENAAKIMGLLLLQDHGEKEMIRLAFGPEVLLHSVVAKARKDLGVLPSSTPSATAAQSPFQLFSRQNSSSRLLGGALPQTPLSVASPSWAPSPAFSRSNGMSRSVNGVIDELQIPDELISSGNLPSSSPFHGASDIIDELQLQNQLSFLNDPAAAQGALPVGPKVSDLFYPEDCPSPNGSGDGMFFPYGMGWGVTGHHRLNCSAATELCLASDAAGAGPGWRPCLYFARGYCKNGSNCRFLHGLPDDAAASMAAGSGMNALVEQQCHELLLRSKSPRLGGASQLMTSTVAFPYSSTVSVPLSPSSRCMSFLQNDSQRTAAAAAAALILGGDDPQKFMGKSRMERSDFAGMVNPGSRQIYLTFPADSTFREEDVSNYFSIYGPVQDVRIPYQQKRMFGFVTFVYPETVKLILAKGNPHFVCDARVLVKPYKEKGKVPDKYRKQQQYAERVGISGCSSPTGLDSRDPYELQQLGGKALYSSSQEALLRRKLEEQQLAAELQQAIELQGRRLMGLQLLDLKNRSLSSPLAATAHINPGVITSPTIATITPSDGRSSGPQEEAPPEDKSGIPAPGTTNGYSQATAAAVAAADQQLDSKAVNAGADKREAGSEASPSENSDFQGCNVEHNLPDSPFASPTKVSFDGESSSVDNAAASHISSGSSNSRLIPSTLLPPTSSFSSCFFEMPRFSSDHGAIGM